jgi:hypothetical protein
LHPLTLTVDPAEPLIAVTQVTNYIRVYNLISITSIIVIFGTLVLASRRLLQQSARLPPQEMPEPTIIPITQVASGDSRDLGLRELYNGVLGVISGITGYTIGSAQTIREYLSQIKGLLNSSLYELFHRISMIYERWLYGPSQRYSKKTVNSLFKDISEHSDEN